MTSDWKVYAVCPNGHVIQEAPFGDKFHVHREVCPECASPKHTWSIKTGRWIPAGTETWWKPNTWFMQRIEWKE